MDVWVISVKYLNLKENGLSQVFHKWILVICVRNRVELICKTRNHIWSCSLVANSGGIQTTHSIASRFCFQFVICDSSIFNPVPKIPGACTEKFSCSRLLKSSFFLHFSQHIFQILFHAISFYRFDPRGFPRQLKLDFKLGFPNWKNIIRAAVF